MTTEVGTTKRKPLTPSQRLKLFEAHGGLCCLCARKIEAGEPWIDEHLRALGLGGSNEWGNRAPVHKRCAAVKTGDDLPRIAKAKAQKRAHLGLKRKSRPIPGSKSSGWRKPFNGPPERRA